MILTIENANLRIDSEISVQKRWIEIFERKMMMILSN